MFTASRRLTLYWVLLLLPTLAVGVGAILLLRREQARLAERTADAVESRRAALAARARLIAENVELLVGDAQNGLLDRLAAEPKPSLDRFLDEWERNNSLVRVTFRSTPLGRIIRPAETTSDPDALAFVRHFSTPFLENPPWRSEPVPKSAKVEAEVREAVSSAQKAVSANVSQQQVSRADAYNFGFSTDNAGLPLARARQEADEVGALKDTSAERRGWTLSGGGTGAAGHLIGWVLPSGSDEIRGVEIEPVELLRLIGGALPVEKGDTEGFAIRNSQGVIIHQVGEVGRAGSALLSIPLLARVPGGLDVAAYMMPSAYSSEAGLFAAGSLLVTLFVVVIAVSGFVLLSQAQRSDAEAALKTSFVANVSHEFKTPLTTIRLYSELLEQGRVGDAAQEKDYLRTIGRETQRLARLVGNVLDFSRLEQGKKKYDLQAIDLVPELARLLETQAPRLAEAGMELTTDLPQAARVTTDRDAVQQVILNLLDNATKYAASGREVLVSLATRAGGGAVVKVADRGPGVPENQRERIFEKFHRVDQSLTSDRSGAGLGLSIARQLARGLGGDLRCEPRQGGGVAFVLELP